MILRITKICFVNNIKVLSLFFLMLGGLIMPSTLYAGCNVSQPLVCGYSEGCNEPCSDLAQCHGCDCWTYACCVGNGGSCIPDCIHRCGPATVCYGNGDCVGDMYECTETSWPDGCGGGGCFTPETSIETAEGEKAIADLKEGENISGLDEKTGQASTGIIDKVYEVSRSAYYKITTKDGQEVKVTGEHPLYAIPEENQPLTFWQYLQTESLVKKVFDFLF